MCGNLGNVGNLPVFPAFGPGSHWQCRVTLATFEVAETRHARARMLDFLNRHLMHPLMAWRASSRHLRHLRTLERTQFDPPEVIRARQLAAVQTQLQHA